MPNEIFTTTGAESRHNPIFPKIMTFGDIDLDFGVGIFHWVGKGIGLSSLTLLVVDLIYFFRILRIKCQ